MKLNQRLQNGYAVEVEWSHAGMTYTSIQTFTDPKDAAKYYAQEHDDTGEQTVRVFSVKQIDVKELSK